MGNLRARDRLAALVERASVSFNESAHIFDVGILRRSFNAGPIDEHAVRPLVVVRLAQILPRAPQRYRRQCSHDPLLKILLPRHEVAVLAKLALAIAPAVFDATAGGVFSIPMLHPNAEYFHQLVHGYGPSLEILAFGHD